MASVSNHAAGWTSFFTITNQSTGFGSAFSNLKRKLRHLCSSISSSHSTVSQGYGSSNNRNSLNRRSDATTPIERSTRTRSINSRASDWSAAFVSSLQWRTVDSITKDSGKRVYSKTCRGETQEGIGKTRIDDGSANSDVVFGSRCNSRMPPAFCRRWGGKRGSCGSSSGHGRLWEESLHFVKTACWKVVTGSLTSRLAPPLKRAAVAGTKCYYVPLLLLLALLLRLQSDYVCGAVPPEDNDTSKETWWFDPSVTNERGDSEGGDWASSARCSALYLSDAFGPSYQVAHDLYLQPGLVSTGVQPSLEHNAAPNSAPVGQFDVVPGAHSHPAQGGVIAFETNLLHEQDASAAPEPTGGEAAGVIKAIEDWLKDGHGLDDTPTPQYNALPSFSEAFRVARRAAVPGGQWNAQGASTAPEQAHSSKLFFMNMQRGMSAPFSSSEFSGDGDPVSESSDRGEHSPYGQVHPSEVHASPEYQSLSIAGGVTPTTAHCQPQDSGEKEVERAQRAEEPRSHLDETRGRERGMVTTHEGGEPVGDAAAGTSGTEMMDGLAQWDIMLAPWLPDSPVASSFLKSSIEGSHQQGCSDDTHYQAHSHAQQLSCPNGAPPLGAATSASAAVPNLSAYSGLGAAKYRRSDGHAQPLAAASVKLRLNEVSAAAGGARGEETPKEEKRHPAVKYYSPHQGISGADPSSSSLPVQSSSWMAPQGPSFSIVPDFLTQLHEATTSQRGTDSDSDAGYKQDSRDLSWPSPSTSASPNLRTDSNFTGHASVAPTDWSLVSPISTGAARVVSGATMAPAFFDASNTPILASMLSATKRTAPYVAAAATGATADAEAAKGTNRGVEDTPASVRTRLPSFQQPPLLSEGRHNHAERFHLPFAVAAHGAAASTSATPSTRPASAAMGTEIQQPPYTGVLPTADATENEHTSAEHIGQQQEHVHSQQVMRSQQQKSLTASRKRKHQSSVLVEQRGANDGGHTQGQQAINTTEIPTPESPGEKLRNQVVFLEGLHLRLVDVHRPSVHSSPLQEQSQPTPSQSQDGEDSSTDVSDDDVIVVTPNPSRAPSPAPIETPLQQQKRRAKILQMQYMQWREEAKSTHPTRLTELTVHTQQLHNGNGLRQQAQEPQHSAEKEVLEEGKLQQVSGTQLQHEGEGYIEERVLSPKRRSAVYASAPGASQPRESQSEVHQQNGTAGDRHADSVPQPRFRQEVPKTIQSAKHGREKIPGEIMPNVSESSGPSRSSVDGYLLPHSSPTMLQLPQQLNQAAYQQQQMEGGATQKPTQREAPLGGISGQGPSTGHLQQPVNEAMMTHLKQLAELMYALATAAVRAPGSQTQPMPALHGEQKQLSTPHQKTHETWQEAAGSGSLDAGANGKPWPGPSHRVEAEVRDNSLYVNKRGRPRMHIQNEGDQSNAASPGTAGSQNGGGGPASSEGDSRMLVDGAHVSYWTASMQQRYTPRPAEQLITNQVSHS